MLRATKDLRFLLSACGYFGNYQNVANDLSPPVYIKRNLRKPTQQNILQKATSCKKDDIHEESVLNKKMH